MCPQDLERHLGEFWEKKMNTTDAHPDNITRTLIKGRMHENKDKCDRKGSFITTFVGGCNISQLGSFLCGISKHKRS